MVCGCGIVAEKVRFVALLPRLLVSRTGVVLSVGGFSAGCAKLFAA